MQQHAAERRDRHREGADRGPHRLERSSRGRFEGGGVHGASFPRARALPCYGSNRVEAPEKTRHGLSRQGGQCCPLSLRARVRVPCASGWDEKLLTPPLSQGEREREGTGPYAVTFHRAPMRIRVRPPVATKVAEVKFPLCVLVAPSVMGRGKSHGLSTAPRGPLCRPRPAPCSAPSALAPRPRRPPWPARTGHWPCGLGDGPPAREEGTDTNATLKGARQSKCSEAVNRNDK